MYLKSKKIVHITFSYGGGLQTALNEFVSKQNNGSHEILIFGKKDGFHKNEFTDNIIITSVTQCLISLYNADVVFLHSTKSGFIRPFIKLLGKYIIFMPHSLHFSQKNLCFITKYLSKTIERVLSIFTNRYLLLGWHEVKALKKIGIKNDFYIIGNKFQENKFKKVHSIYFPDKYIFLCGRIHKQKNPIYLLKLLSTIKRYNYEVIWAGDGDIEMKNALIENGVIVTGWVDPDIIYNYLLKCKFVLHLADMEGLPIVFLEACKFAKSKIICVKKDYSWFIPDQYKFKTPQQFDAIVRKIEKSPDFFDKLDYILNRRFDSDKIVNKWNKVMSEVLSEQASNSSK